MNLSQSSGPSPDPRAEEIARAFHESYEFYELKDAASRWLDNDPTAALIFRLAREWSSWRHRAPLEEGDEVEHADSGWAGPVIAIDGDLVTVRPMHPEPRTKPPGRWEGWRPITVSREELIKL